MAAAFATVALIAAACSGPRPTLTSQAGSAQTVAAGETDDPVVELLRAPAATFTATYTIQSTQDGAEPADAEVVVDGTQRRVTVRDVAFYTTTTGEFTCTADGCVDGLQQGAISDLSVAEGFWGPSSATRLVSDIARRIGNLNHYTSELVGETATCVDIPLAGPSASGTVSYCALPSGVLASYSGADTTITITSYKQGADPSALVPPDQSG